jgi:glycosyltransferase involved in cell wall biosynthesis
MHVIFDARHLQTVSRTRGIGRYSRNLLAAFARRAGGAGVPLGRADGAHASLEHADRRDAHAPRPDGAASEIEWTLLRLRSFPPADAQALPPHGDLAVVRPRRPELAMLALDAVMLSAELAWAGRATVYHSVQLGLPAMRRARTVLTVHDLAPLHWPEHYLRWPHVRVGHMWQYALAQRADAIVAVSEATAAEVTDRLRIPRSRIRVIPEAVDAEFAPPGREAGQRIARQRFGVPSRYVLYVGQFDPRKNMDGLLAAFARAAEDDRDLRLVVVGELGKLASHLHQALERTGAPRDRVVVTGFVDDAALASLYAGAECLLHAALLEGFGLTPLEALAAGTPVVGYRAGAVEEVVGDAGLLVEPGENEALGEALCSLLSSDSLAAELRGRTRARATLFSWDKAAEQTIDLYRSLG